MEEGEAEVRVKPMDDAVDVSDHKVRILHDAQHQEVNNDREHHVSFPDLAVFLFIGLLLIEAHFAFMLLDIGLGFGGVFAYRPSEEIH